MKRMLCTIIATAAAAASLFIFFGRKSNDTAIAVEVYTLREETVYESFVCSGSAEALVCQNVVLGRPAVITEVCVAEGDVVETGQLLLKCKFLDGEELLEASFGVLYAEVAQRIAELRYDFEDKALLASAVYGTDFPSYLTDYYLPQQTQQEYQEYVYASADGIVSGVYVSQGDTVSGAFASVVVREPDLKISINVPERYISKIELGQAVNVSADSLGDTVVAGRICELGNKAVEVGGLLSDPEKVIRCTVSFDNSKGLVGENYTVTARVFCREFLNAIVVPYEAIFQEDGKEYVFVYSEGRVEKRLVGALFENETGVISSTVSSAEQVVILPVEGICDGMKAEVDT